MRDITIC